MERVKELISEHVEHHRHLEEYFKIIDVIQTNVKVNPDICIESCKALIEGVSKTVLLKLDKTKTPENIDADDLPRLFKSAMSLLAKECEDVDGNFLQKFQSIIHVICELRNKRGDISHGRMAPKPLYSSPKLAVAIQSITESMMYYILEFYFTLKEKPAKLDFESDEMERYNQWLDESVEFPVAKARYSRILFEYDYDEYESRYSDEYLMFLRTQDDSYTADDVGLLEGDPIEKEKQPFDEGMAREWLKEFQISDIFSEGSAASGSHSVGDDKKEVVDLSHSFDRSAFWNKTVNDEIEKFASAHKLKAQDLKKVIDGYLFTSIRPLRDDVANLMTEKPPLKERADKTEDLINRILLLVKRLKAIKSGK